MALQHLVGLVAAVATEVAVQEVDHGPQVAALLDVDLEQVAHVVERRGGQREVTLLLDRCRLGVALHHDQASQIGSVLTGHLLPHVLTLVVAEGDLAVGLGLGQEDAPPVVGHLDVVEVGPALPADVDGGAQVDGIVLGTRPGPDPPTSG